MNFKDNIKKIRKDNNLSQEELADKLGVTRQSVSKWEQGLAYPEMDKVLTICKMFNYSIDDLLNENIDTVKEYKQRGNNLNKLIDDFLAYLNKTINLFSSMSFWQILKCICERTLVILILFIIFAIGKTLLGLIVDDFVRFIPIKGINIIHGVFNSIYNLFAVLFGIFIFLYIFKVRYLDYYEFVKKSDLKHEDKKEEDKDNKTIILDDKKEKIVIRDPKHSGYRFFAAVAKVILFFVKLFVAWIAICGLFTLVSLVTAFIISFLFIKTGLMFVGAILIIVSLIAINITVLNALYNFIMSKKNKVKKFFISIISATIVLGIGLGLCFIAASSFDVYEGELLTKSKTITMKDDLYIDNWHNVRYIETDSNDVKITVNYYEYYDARIEVDEEDNSISIIINNISKMNTMGLIRKQIQDINNKRINTNNGYYTEVRTSKENIKKLMNNYEKYWGYRYENEE